MPKLRPGPTGVNRHPRPERSTFPVPPPPAMPTDAYARIYAVIRRVPRGRVVTYGQVAALAGLPGRARQVGYADLDLAHERHGLGDGQVALPVADDE